MSQSGVVRCLSGIARYFSGIVRWEDIIREWTSLEFAKPQRAVENRGKWRKLVTKSFVVPQ